VLFENVLNAMDALTDKGFSFALCTNKTERMARILLEELGVTKRFKSITGGDTFKFRKPDAKHLSETARLAGHDVSKAIMIGDSAADIDAANNAGIPSVAVTFGYTDTPVEQLGATKIISNYNDLEEQIESISMS
jgi:phosphoglycolate phosphatase